MRKYSCPVCKQESCGHDSHTVTKYRGPEKAAGDRTKVILSQIYDLSAYDNLQIAEIKALINCLIDEHLQETEGEEDA